MFLMDFFIDDSPATHKKSFTVTSRLPCGAVVSPPKFLFFQLPIVTQEKQFACRDRECEQLLSAARDAIPVSKTLLIVCYSLTGGARSMAEAAACGAACEPGIVIRMIAADTAQPADLLAADGLLFATPEMLGGLAGVMKDFFDRCYYPVLGRIEGRPYAAMICAGSDGENAARQLARIVTGWRLRAMADPLIVRTNAQSPEAILAPKRLAVAELESCRVLGMALATGLAMGIY